MRGVLVAAFKSNTRIRTVVLFLCWQKDERCAAGDEQSVGRFYKQQNQSEYVEIQILQASIQKCKKGRIVPALVGWNTIADD